MQPVCLRALRASPAAAHIATARQAAHSRWVVPARRFTAARAQAAGEGDTGDKPAPAQEQHAQEQRALAPRGAFETSLLTPSWGRMNQVGSGLPARAPPWVAGTVPEGAGSSLLCPCPVMPCPALPSSLTALFMSLQMFKEMEHEMAAISSAFGLPSMLGPSTGLLDALPSVAAELPAVTSKSLAVVSAPGDCSYILCPTTCFSWGLSFCRRLQGTALHTAHFRMPLPTRSSSPLSCAMSPPLPPPSPPDRTSRTQAARWWSTRMCPA